MPILTAEERIGTTIGGRYRLERLIGRGGMATVLEATHTMNGRKVAVKLLNPELATDADVVARFIQEARAAAVLDHPNVVSVLDTGQDADGTPFLVLELLRGETLAACLKRQGRLSLDELTTVILPVLEALAAAHARGIVHRDIKPDNVFLALDATGRMTPKLLDFGIARVAESSRNTATGVALGTPYYMSPEQVEAPSTVGPSSDVWSMGVMLYQCLTGTLPFQGATPSGVLVAIMTTAPPSLASRGLGIAPGITAVVDHAMSRDPHGRFPNAHELALALVAAARGHAVTPAAPPRGGVGRGLAFVVLTVAVLIVGGAIAGAYLYARGELGPLLASAGLGGLGLGGPQPVAIRPVVVGADAGMAVATDAGVVASADAGVTADATLVASADLDADAPSDAGPLAMMFGLPDGSMFPANMPHIPHMPSSQELAMAARMLEQYQRMAEAQERARAGHENGAPSTDLARRAHACGHDDDCVIDALRGHAMTDEELSLLVEAYRRENRRREMVRPLARYLERYPTGPHAVEYARLLQQGAQ